MSLKRKIEIQKEYIQDNKDNIQNVINDGETHYTMESLKVDKIILEKELKRLENIKQYTMKDLRKYYEDLKGNISAEVYRIYAPKESGNIIKLIISSEEIIINKRDNTVTSSFKNYNSVHEIVEELLNR